MIDDETKSVLNELVRKRIEKDIQESTPSIEKAAEACIKAKTDFEDIFNKFFRENPKYDIDFRKMDAILNDLEETNIEFNRSIKDFRIFLDRLEEVALLNN